MSLLVGALCTMLSPGTLVVCWNSCSLLELLQSVESLVVVEVYEARALAGRPAARRDLLVVTEESLKWAYS